MRVNTPSVVYETIDGETILLNLRTGNYYSFEGIGAFIWDFIEEKAGFNCLPDIITEVYSSGKDQIESDLLGFVEKLKTEELVVEDPLDLNLSEDLISHYVTILKGLGPDYNPPKMNKYSDMQDLLLLDPIHEVDEKGWPEKKPSNI